MRETPMTWDELPRVTTTDDDGTKHVAIDWSAIGFKVVDKNPETGEPWLLHKGDQKLHGALYLWLENPSAALEAGFGAAILNAANGTSWKVSQDDVNRAYILSVLDKGKLGAVVTETLLHRLYDRIAGIRRKAEYRAPTVKIVTVTVRTIALPDGKPWQRADDMDRETAVADLRSSWLSATMDLGIPAPMAKKMVESMNFDGMLGEEPAKSE